MHQISGKIFLDSACREYCVVLTKIKEVLMMVTKLYEY